MVKIVAIEKVIIHIEVAILKAILIEFNQIIF